MQMGCQTLAALWVTTLPVTLAPVDPALVDGAIRRSAATEAVLQHTFSAADERILDEIERACFLYFWKEVGSPARLAKDRLKAPVASIAAVGFQLSSLPVGVERGWISKAAGAERATTVLRSLLSRRDNQRHGMYLHFPDMDTAGPSRTDFVVEASTVDTALLIAGAMPAATFFGGEVATLVDRLIAEANWRRYAVAAGGRISMGWKPHAGESLQGRGEFIRWHWHNASDEERLVYFLAVGSPTPTHSVAPEQYYRLTRTQKRYKELPPFVVSWPGNLFTYFFSHCWIDYRSLGIDDPQAFGVAAPGVDWFENSRRAVLSHRARCLDMSARYRTLSENSWGLSPCVARRGYAVPHTFPALAPEEKWYDGTVAPYAAGASIMFTPTESMAALRTFRTMKDDQGRPLLWRDPDDGGYGLVDSFNLDQGFVCDDYVGIDQGPLLLAIENARTGLVWKLFMAHPNARRAVERLRLGTP